MNLAPITATPPVSCCEAMHGCDIGSRALGLSAPCSLKLEVGQSSRHTFTVWVECQQSSGDVQTAGARFARLRTAQVFHNCVTARKLVW